MSRKLIVPGGLIENNNETVTIHIPETENQGTADLITERQDDIYVAHQAGVAASERTQTSESTRGSGVGSCQSRTCRSRSSGRTAQAEKVVAKHEPTVPGPSGVNRSARAGPSHESTQYLSYVNVDEESYQMGFHPIISSTQDSEAFRSGEESNFMPSNESDRIFVDYSLHRSQEDQYNIISGIPRPPCICPNPRDQAGAGLGGTYTAAAGNAANATYNAGQRTTTGGRPGQTYTTGAAGGAPLDRTYTAAAGGRPDGTYTSAAGSGRRLDRTYNIAGGGAGAGGGRFDRIYTAAAGGGARSDATYNARVCNAECSGHPNATYTAGGCPDATYTAGVCPDATYTAGGRPNATYTAGGYPNATYTAGGRPDATFTAHPSIRTPPNYLDYPPFDTAVPRMYPSRFMDSYEIMGLTPPGPETPPRNLSRTPPFVRRLEFSDAPDTPPRPFSPSPGPSNHPANLNVTRTCPGGVFGGNDSSMGWFRPYMDSSHLSSGRPTARQEIFDSVRVGASPGLSGISRSGPQDISSDWTSESDPIFGPHRSRTFSPPPGPRVPIRGRRLDFSSGSSEVGGGACGAECPAAAEGSVPSSFQSASGPAYRDFYGTETGRDGSSAGYEGDVSNDTTRAGGCGAECPGVGHEGPPSFFQPRASSTMRGGRPAREAALNEPLPSFFQPGASSTMYGGRRITAGYRPAEPSIDGGRVIQTPGGGLRRCRPCELIR